MPDRIGIGPVELIVMLTTIVIYTTIIVVVVRFFLGLRAGVERVGNVAPQLKKCPGCAAEVALQSNYCSNCGVRFSA